MKITDFKVGDKVKVVGSPKSLIHNKCGTISSVYDRGVVVKIDDLSGWNFWEDDDMWPISALQKIEDKPKSQYKFKVGDRVIGTDKSVNSAQNSCAGCRGTVKELSTQPYVSFDNDSLNRTIYNGCRVSSMQEEQLELDPPIDTISNTFYSPSIANPDILYVPNPFDVEKIVGCIPQAHGHYHVTKNANNLTYSLIKKTKMSLTKFAKKLFAPDVVTLIDAGFIDDCGSGLTSNGKNALMDIIYEEKKAELVKKAAEILEEQKAEEAKK